MLQPFHRESICIISFFFLDLPSYQHYFISLWSDLQAARLYVHVSSENKIALFSLQCQIKCKSAASFTVKLNFLKNIMISYTLFITDCFSFQYAILIVLKEK